MLRRSIQHNSVVGSGRDGSYKLLKRPSLGTKKGYFLADTGRHTGTVVAELENSILGAMVMRKCINHEDRETSKPPRSEEILKISSIHNKTDC